MGTNIESVANAAYQYLQQQRLRLGSYRPAEQPVANVANQDGGDTVNINNNLLRAANLNLDVDAEGQEPAEERASQTNLEYQRREATVLKLRTQEGDIVKLKFRSVENTSIEAGQEVDGEKVVSNLEISSSSRTRLLISVKGDINDAELAAIQTVADQASQLAGEFFDGNLNEAFAAASSFAIDGSQLAKVSLRLSVRERLNFAQSVVTNAPAAAIAPPAGDDAGEVVPQQTQPANTLLKPVSSTSTPSTTRTDAPLPAAPATATTTTAPASDDQAPATEEPAAPSTLLDAFQALADLLNAIADFIDNLVNSFQAEPEPVTDEAAESTASVFNLRFKLDLFAAVVKTTLETAPSTEQADGELLLGDTLAAVGQEVDPQSVADLA